MDKPTVVAATGAASVSLTGNRKLSEIIEKAMSDAVKACMAKGIVDPVKVREAMMEARAAAKNAHH